MKRFLFVFNLILLCLPAKFLFSQTKTINVNNELALFLDTSIVEKYYDGASIILHHPVERGVAFYFDKPWEGISSTYVTIIKHDNKYRAYYRGGGVKTDKGLKFVTCVAESKDGITWYKPNLGLFSINGTKNNNIVIFNDENVSHNFTPFIDESVKNNINLYKAIGGTEAKGLFLYFSNDGIHWNKVSNSPFYTNGNFDSQNVMFYSTYFKCYFLYFRKWVRVNGKLVRDIGVTKSTDLKDWEKYSLINLGKGPIENLYTNQVSPYYRAPHYFISIGARLFQGKKVLSNVELNSLRVNKNYRDDCSDAYIMLSKNGEDFERAFLSSFIRPGIGDANWTSRTNFPALNLVQTSDSELSIYVCKNYMQPGAHLQRYTLRIDGFASLNADFNGGSAITKPFVVKEDNLVINYSSSAAGEVAIELLDVNNNPIYGYTKSNCDLICGDEISRNVTWQGKNLANLKGKTVKIRFYLQDADVFSFILK